MRVNAMVAGSGVRLMQNFMKIGHVLNTRTALEGKQWLSRSEDRVSDGLMVMTLSV
jgi:hypothetical protein